MFDSIYNSPFEYIFIHSTGLMDKEVILNKRNIVLPSLVEIEDEYDLFFFDVHGIIHSGGKAYNEVLLRMDEMRRNGKKIVIVSNATEVSNEYMESLRKKGVIKGIHYDDIITSGDHFLELYSNGNMVRDSIRIAGKEIGYNERIRIFIFGTPNISLLKLLEDNYEVVNNLDDAHVVYTGSPCYTKEEVFGIDNEYVGKPVSDGKFRFIHSRKLLESISNFLVECKKRNLVLINPNPDPKNPYEDQTQTMGNGKLLKEYCRIGGIVLESGKGAKRLESTSGILDLAIERFGLNCQKEKMIMVGDTKKTDIYEAEKSGIDSALLISIRGNAGLKLKKSTKYLDKIGAKHFIYGI